ncbi:hypothetical protein U1Q18_035321 [Sarracenia purpurea var. burkii]
MGINGFYTSSGSSGKKKWRRRQGYTGNGSSDKKENGSAEAAAVDNVVALASGRWLLRSNRVGADGGEAESNVVQTKAGPPVDAEVAASMRGSTVAKAGT